MSAPRAPSVPPPKTMSSRLLTMKFMQRGAASASSTTAPSTPHYRSNKRQRLSNGRSSPATTTSHADARAVQAALATEEAKRQAALDRHAYDAGETKWVLSVKEETTEGRVDGGLRVMKMGEGDDVLRGVEVKEEEAVPWGDGGFGRRSFGMFNKALEKRQNRGGRSSSEESGSSASDSSRDSDEENSNDEDNLSGVDALIREEQSEAAQSARTERKAKRRSTDAEAVRPAGKRRKGMKEVQLSKLSSISGTGGSQRPENQQKEKKTIARMGRIRDRNMQY